MTQEVEAVLAITDEDDAGLVGMQAQPESDQHRLDPALCLFGTAPAGGEDDEIIRVADQRPQTGRVRPGRVDDVQGDVGQQRGNG